MPTKTVEAEVIAAEKARESAPLHGGINALSSGLWLVGNEKVEATITRYI